MSLSKHNQIIIHYDLTYLLAKYPKVGASIVKISRTIYQLASYGRGINESPDIVAISYLSYRYLVSRVDGSSHRADIFQYELDKLLHGTDERYGAGEQLDNTLVEFPDWSNKPHKQAELACNLLSIYDLVWNDLASSMILNQLVRYLTKHLGISTSLIYIIPNSHSSITDSTNIFHKLFIYSAVQLESTKRQHKFGPTQLAEESLYDNLNATINKELNTPAPISIESSGSLVIDDSLLTLLRMFKLSLPNNALLQITVIKKYTAPNDGYIYTMRIGAKRYLLYQTDFYCCDRDTIDEINNSGIAKVTTSSLVPPVNGGCYDPDNPDINDSSVLFGTGKNRWSYALVAL